MNFGEVGKNVLRIALAINIGKCKTITTSLLLFNKLFINCSLETYHIIECGYTIKCKASYDIGLYEHLGNNTDITIKSPFMTHNAYTAKIISLLNEVSNEYNMQRCST